MRRPHIIFMTFVLLIVSCMALIINNVIGHDRHC